MATYYVDEAAFELEDGAFDDRTVHVLQAPEASAHDVGILLSRSPLAAGSTLREHVLRHCDHEARAFRAYKRLDSRELDVDGAPALEVSTEWRGSGGRVFQRQLFIGLRGRVLLLGVTSPLAERPLAEAHYARALATLRLRAEV